MERVRIMSALPPKADKQRLQRTRIGREFSLEGMLESYTQRKNVTVNLTH